MSYSVYTYLTDAKKVMYVYGSKDKQIFNRLYQSLKDGFDQIDSSFSDRINNKNNSYAILENIVNGKIQFPEVPYMYGYVYEKICEFYGYPIFNDEYIWQLDNQSAFIPIPFSQDFPYIISVGTKSLQHKKEQYLSLKEGQGIGDYDYDQEREDLTFIFDEAIERNMDLIISVY